MKALVGCLALSVVCAPPARADALRVTHFDVSPPLRDMALTADAMAPALLQQAEGAALSGAPPASPLHVHATAAIPTLGTGFAALTNTCSCVPPSPSLDVGRDHVFLAVNLSFAIYDTAGTLLVGPALVRSIWSGFGGACENNNPGNPIVLYDQLADRWLVSQMSGFVAPYGMCVAVSTSGDPTGSWYRWHYSTGDFYADIPKWAMWPDAFVAAAAEFLNGSSFMGVGVYAFKRADLLAGVPSPAIVRLVTPLSPEYAHGHSLQPVDLDGYTPPPPGSPALLLGSMDDAGPYGASQDALALWRFHADFDTPASSTLTYAGAIATNAFSSNFPCTGTSLRNCIPQPGTAVRLDFVRKQRVMNRAAYRNFGTHESVVAAQSVEASAGVAGMRWYELRDPNGAPFLQQQGTFDPGEGLNRWMGAISMDHEGDIALAYSVSSATEFPGIRVTGRLASDAPGSMGPTEAVVVTGTGSQTTSTSRWGDYSTMVVDPDDCTFWYVNEYVPVTSALGWRTHVSSFKFSSCSPVVLGVEKGGGAPERTELDVVGPLRGRASLVFSLTSGGPRRVLLDVFDLAGRRVRRLLEGVYGAGRYHATWDGKSDAGESVRAGIYFARLTAGGESDSETVPLLR